MGVFPAELTWSSFDRGPGLTACTAHVGGAGAARAGFGRTRGGRLTRLGDLFTIAT